MLRETDLTGYFICDAKLYAKRDVPPGTNPLGLALKHMRSGYVLEGGYPLGLALCKAVSFGRVALEWGNPLGPLAQSRANFPTVPPKLIQSNVFRQYL